MWHFLLPSWLPDDIYEDIQRPTDRHGSNNGWSSSEFESYDELSDSETKPPVRSSSKVRLLLLKSKISLPQDGAVIWAHTWHIYKWTASLLKKYLCPLRDSPHLCSLNALPGLRKWAMGVLSVKLALCSVSSLYLVPFSSSLGIPWPVSPCTSLLTLLLFLLLSLSWRDWTFLRDRILTFVWQVLVFVYLCKVLLSFEWYCDWYFVAFLWVRNQRKQYIFYPKGRSV